MALDCEMVLERESRLCEGRRRLDETTLECHLNVLQTLDSILTDGLFISCNSLCGKGQVARSCVCGNEQA
jgi:hypothetical protein